MTAHQPNGTPPPASPGGGVPSGADNEWYAQVDGLAQHPVPVEQAAPSWEDRADQLLGLLIAAAVTKGVATRTHAQAWLAADGAGVQRDQVAKLVAAGSVLAADVAKARVEAFRLVLDAQRLDDLPLPPRPRAELSDPIPLAEVDAVQVDAARLLALGPARGWPGAADVVGRLLAVVKDVYGPPGEQS